MAKTLKEILLLDQYTKLVELDKLYKKYPLDSEIAYNYAVTVIAKKSFKPEEIDKAIKVLLNVEDYNQDKVNFKLAIAYRKINQYDIAFKYLDIVEKTSNLTFKYKARFEKAMILSKLGKYEEAISEFRRTSGLGVSDSEARIKIAQMYELMGNTKTSVNILLSLITVETHRNRALFQLARLEKKLGHFEISISYFKDLLGTSYNNTAQDEINKIENMDNYKKSLEKKEDKKYKKREKKYVYSNALEVNNTSYKNKKKVNNNKRKKNKVLIKDSINEVTKENLQELRCYLYANLNSEDKKYVNVWDSLEETLYLPASNEGAIQKIKKYSQAGNNIRKNENV